MQNFSTFFHHPSLNETALERLSGVVARCLEAGDVLALSGDLGAGKTVAARAAIRALSPHEVEDITSPTYALLQPYPVVLASGQPATLWHMDAYRLSDDSNPADEMHDPAMYEELIQSGVLLVEWPEHVPAQVLASALSMRIAHTHDPHVRDVTLSGSEAFLKKLENHLAAMHVTEV